MTFEEVNQRALEVREKYAQLELQRTGLPWSRAELMQGFVGDVGDLAKLVMAKDGRRSIENVDAMLAHELADCLWSVLVIADKCDVNLQEAFTHTMQELDDRINAELTS
jgi:NTP pyrophosphatase (non-canonical NTP hydrolase)